LGFVLARTGRPPKPLEQKRRLGNPGKRALPETTVALVRSSASHEPPEPLRPLGTFGLQFWNRLWNSGAIWISAHSDIELVQIICEQIDERQGLRRRVLLENDWRERTGLRQLDSQIIGGLSMLGFTPTDRTRLGLAEVKFENKLDDYRRRKAKMVDSEVVLAE
jgi:hypothetical protein